ncbi:hypothetical protein CYY_009564, partial [Polysphondylium violaceum]
MIIYDDQWNTPTCNKVWKVEVNKRFTLEVYFDRSGIVKKEKLVKIPKGTIALELKIKGSGSPHRKGADKNRYVELDIGLIPPTVTRIDIQEKKCRYRPYVLYEGEWIPDSVTMLSIPSLPFPLSLIPDNVKYLKVQQQLEEIAETSMVPPSIENLWIESLSRNYTPHDIPNTVKELVLGSCSLDDMHITPTFTSPIHINDLKVYNDEEIENTSTSDDSIKIDILQNMVECNLNVQSIVISRPFTLVNLPPTLTSLIITNDTMFNNSLSSLDPLPPQLKYLSLPSSYQQPIYQLQTHIPTTLSHLELTVTVYKTTFTNDWLGKKGYLPLSIIHLKVNLEINSIGEKDGQDCDETLSSGLQIILPSSIQSVCLVPNNEKYRKHVSIIDKQDYYSTTPLLPKIREGLKELVLPKKFNQVININSFPSTLRSLSILNPYYNHQLNSNNLPATLTSFKCVSDMIELDLSAYQSIKELSVHGDSIINYPPNIETLDLQLKEEDENYEHYYHSNHNSVEEEYQFNFGNTHLIKNLTYRSGSQSNLEKLLDLLPNVQSLWTHDIYLNVPSSVTELKSFLSRISYHPILPNLKHVHLDLETYVLNIPRVVNNERDEKKKSFIPRQLPMHDTFFKLWRNVYLKPMILEAFCRSPLIFDGKTGTLEHMDKFKHYNIIIKNKEQLVPALSKFDKADEIYIREKGEKDDLSKLISRSIKKLRCTFTTGIPKWISHLTLDNLNSFDYFTSEIPPSVTNLTIEVINPGDTKSFPTTIKYLTLDKLDSFYGTCPIPPSVTYLTLYNQLFNQINQDDIPSTVQKIEFKKLVFESYSVRSYDIPSYISSRLVNGVFYIYSKSNNRTTIPPNTTHLFWADSEQYIDNDGDGINMPPSVHTLVLGQTFNSAILSLPPTITQMIFNGRFKKPLKFISFPPALKYLSFASLDTLPQENELPNGITHLSIGDTQYFDSNSVPQSVHHMQSSFKGYDADQIPPQVKHLKIAGCGNQIYLPTTTIKSFVTSPYDKIIFRDHNSQRYLAQNKSLPFSSSAHTIDLIDNTSIMNVPYTLGNNIKSITFGPSINKVLLKGAIPNSVEKIMFGDKFNHKLNKSILPTSLLTLVLGRDFNQDLNDNIPSSLTELVLNTKSKPSFTSSSQFP